MEPQGERSWVVSTERCVTRTPLISAAETAAILGAGCEPVLIEMVEAACLHANPRTRARGMGRIAAEHRHTGSEFGSAEGNHVLPVKKRVRTRDLKLEKLTWIVHQPDVTGDELTLVRRGIHQNPLYQVVAILITCDCGRLSMLKSAKRADVPTYYQSEASGASQRGPCKLRRDSDPRTLRLLSSSISPRF